MLEATGAAGSENIAHMLEAISAHDSGTALSLFAGLWRDGKDPAGVLGDLNSLMRDVLMLSVSPKGGEALTSGAYSSDTLRRFGHLFTREELLAHMVTAQEGISLLKDSPSARTTAELTLVRLCTPSAEPSALEARLSRLEKILSGTPVVSPAPSAVQDAKPVLPPPPSPERQPEPEPAAKPQAVREEPAVSAAQNDLPPWTDEDAPPPPDDGDAPPWDDEPVPAAPQAGKGACCSASAARCAGTHSSGHGAYSSRSGCSLRFCGLRLGPLCAAGCTEAGRGVPGALPQRRRRQRRTGRRITLVIRLSAGILYNGLSTPNNLEILRATACELAGREIHVRVLPMGDAAQRSLDELRAFREVRFIRKDGN